MKLPNQTQISIIILFLWLGVGQITAQTIKLSASDGEYSRYVLITWDKVKEATSYRVLRSMQNIPEDREVITDWQTAQTWRDGKAKQGMKYHYSIEVLHHPGQTFISKSDIGYRAVLTDMAVEELLSYEEAMGHPQGQVMLKDTILMSRPEIIGTWKPRKSIEIRIALCNIGLKHIKNANISYYLSEDNLLDTKDILLTKKEAIHIIGRADPIIVKQKKRAPKTRAKYLIAVLKHKSETKAVTHTLIR